MSSNSKPIRVCVLVASYEGSDSELKEFEGAFYQTPQNHFPSDNKEFVFTLHEIKKATAYRQIRQLVMSGEYDVFYNQCDGAKDEDRAGEEVVRTLEEFHVPFTGAVSKYYEMSKPDMKHVAHFYGIDTAPFAVLEPGDDIAKECEHLRFPLIIKHISGYSSVGMDRSCKVFDTEELVARATRFVEEYQFALVEEFITGDEATILACGDSSEPMGVRVFHPVQVSFPPGEDFKHFQLKWECFEGMEWQHVAADDPALPSMVEMARKAFHHMMDGVGYGRIDVRIDRATNTVVFLEINPNCGIMYPVGQEGSADWILRLNEGFKQQEFARLQIREAMRRVSNAKPLFKRTYRPDRGYSLRAVRDIPRGTVVFADEMQPVRVCTKPYMQAHLSREDYNEFVQNAWPLGSDGHYYALWDRDPTNWRFFSHSCAPNLAFGGDRSLNVEAITDIKKGDELTMDYRDFMDATMPPFKCHCGAPGCKSIIVLGSKLKQDSEGSTCGNTTLPTSSSVLRYDE